MSARRLTWIAATLGALALLVALPYALAWRPAAHEPAAFACTADAPQLLAGQALKVMTWNLQFLAGPRPASRTEPPASADLAVFARQLDTVAAVVRAEQPDLLLLQELHDGSRASAGEDQLALLQARLADLYPCRAAAFYRKAWFDPQPSVFGRVGHTLGILSRFQLAGADRDQLPRPAVSPWRAPFASHPALLSVRLPMRPGGELEVLTTQFDPLDATIADQQATATVERLQAQRGFWLLGADTGRARPTTPADTRLQRIPARQDERGPGGEAWRTYGDEVRDYLWLSGELKRVDAAVRRDSSATVSAHLPVVVRLLLPPPD